jgi:UDP-glucuronate 4-epimerase
VFRSIVDVAIKTETFKADSNMKILVTGSAGFIGAALTYSLLQRGDEVIGVDNHNNYYDISLKEARIQRFINHSKYTHIRMDIANRDEIADVFKIHKPNRVVNLAAQAGVRYSLENPQAYIDSNIVGFANILEGCRRGNVEHLVYASSSSVYGANTSYPFSVSQRVEHPLSLYAATKRSNELMAHSYSHLYGVPTTGLRFFTVYGPWGRPDMALFKFAKAIIEGRPIQVYNHGKHTRDFTYIDDVVHGILEVLDRPASPDPAWNGLAPTPNSSHAPYKLYNVGSGAAVTLIEYIEALESALGQAAKKEWLPAQPGDVPATHSDITELAEDFGYRPATLIRTGVVRFVEWYLRYINKSESNPTSEPFNPLK